MKCSSEAHWHELHERTASMGTLRKCLQDAVPSQELGMRYDGTAEPLHCVVSGSAASQNVHRGTSDSVSSDLKVSHLASDTANHGRGCVAGQLL